MAVFPIHLLIAVCFCGFSNLHYGQVLSCRVNSTRTVKFYAKQKNNVIDCRRSFHGNRATYSWKWYNATDDTFIPLPANQNITTHGGELHFDLSPAIKEFKCEIAIPSNPNYQTLYFPVIEAKMIQTNPNAPLIYYQATEYSFLSIPCSAEGLFLSDDLYYIWYLNYDDHEAMINDTSRTYVDSRGNLNFSPVLTIDELYQESRVYYHCAVNSSKVGIRVEGPQVLIYVEFAAPNFVHYKPLLQFITPDIVARVRDSIMLECVFSSDMPNSYLHYKWYAPNGERLTSSMGYRYFNHDKVKQRLYLDNVQFNYEGYWSCGADNTHFNSFRQGIFVKVIC